MHFATEAEYFVWARQLTARLREVEAESLDVQKDVTALRTFELPQPLRHGAPQAFVKSTLQPRRRSFGSTRRPRR